MRRLCLLACSLTALAQTPVFKSDTTLQSIAVQVTDKQGNAIKGLSAGDFTLLEDGRPQKISFFGAGKQPTSLAVLVDSSASMSLGGKLIRAKALLGPLLRGNHPEDEIFLVPFTDRLQSFTRLTTEQRLHPPEIRVSASGGTSFYDALASALCHMRSAQNVKQAVVVITDGADQNSRLNLEQLIQLTRSSNAQVFTIGFFDKSESDILHQSARPVTLVGEREIDNPVVVFDRLAKESGAESFFPTSERGLQQALDRIFAILEAQYTLAYYPADTSRFRKIEIKVKRGGVKVLSRRGVGADGETGMVHFSATSCEVSAKDHPYPWELRATRDPSGALTWHEDFTDPRTGWPNRHELIPAPRRPRDIGGDPEWKPGVRYIPGGYELSNTFTAGPVVDSVVAAQGTFWNNFRASVVIDSTASVGAATGIYQGTAPALVFHMGTGGYYALVLTGAGRDSTHDTSFKLVKRTFSPASEVVIVPWTKVAFRADKKQRRVSVQYQRGKIDVLVDDQRVTSVQDATYPNGLIGLGLFGHGRAVFHDLLVEELPSHVE
jgi:Ca-activated chloride channel family protein